MIVPPLRRHRYDKRNRTSVGNAAAPTSSRCPRLSPSGRRSRIRSVLASEWNALEVAKLVVAILTPTAVALLGLYVRSAGRRIEDAQWSSRRVLDWRLDLYKAMAPR